MNFSSMFIFILLTFLSNILKYSETLKLWNSKCPEITIPNSRIRIRARGRLAKIRCLDSYTMIEGDRRLTCINKKWNGRIPHCISKGCTKSTLNHGEAIELYGGALVHFECDLGYEIQGSPAIFCDGVNWNDTYPDCIIPPEDPNHKICYFEAPDLCNWKQDSLDSFNWIWSSADVNAFPGSLGAKVDHTTGTSAGHYIYVDPKKDWSISNTARIFSPVIRVPDNAISCIVFWYHFWDVHDSSANLNVYLLTPDVPFEMTLPELKIVGVDDDDWHLIFLSLRKATDDWFQVVFEAQSTMGLMANIAIDDFRVETWLTCIDASIAMHRDKKLINSRKPPIFTTEMPQSTTTLATETTYKNATLQEVSSTELPTIIISEATSEVPTSKRRTVVFETTVSTTNNDSLVTPPKLMTTLTPRATTKTYKTTVLKQTDIATSQTTEKPKSTTSTNIFTNIIFTRSTSTMTSKFSTELTKINDIQSTVSSTIQSTVKVLEQFSIPSVANQENLSSGVLIYIIIGSLGFLFFGGTIGFLWYKKSLSRSQLAEDSDVRWLKDDAPDEEQNCERDEMQPNFPQSYQELQNSLYPQEDDGTPV